MLTPFRSLSPRPGEVAAALPGDNLVPDAGDTGVVMDRAFDLPAPPEAVWPWFVQLGKDRAGWYLPLAVELLVPPGRRALRRVEPTLQGLAVGDVIPDWGGRDAHFEVARLDPPRVLVHRSVRGRMRVSWAIVLAPEGTGATHTRVHLRLRLGGVRRRRLAEVGGGLVDLLTIAGLAAGLRERVALPR
ncbi:hypothetical protein ACFP3Q_17235 [Nocardioides sp. GCM10027113]|uniref:hypothetical protein n=1 Tax=unclassified Nocardioides TaxID=2615069 RepID=UPI0036183818